MFSTSSNDEHAAAGVASTIAMTDSNVVVAVGVGDKSRSIVDNHRRAVACCPVCRFVQRTPSGFFFVFFCIKKR